MLSYSNLNLANLRKKKNYKKKRLKRHFLFEINIYYKVFEKYVFFLLHTIFKVRKRLKNEPGVCCVAITSNASRIVFGVMGVNRYVQKG